MVKVRTEAWRIWLQVMLFITLPYCLSAKLTKSPSPTPRFLETQCLSRRRDSAGLSLLLLFLGVHFMWIVSLSTVPPFYSWCYIYILSAYICILIYLYKYILIKIYIYIYIKWAPYQAWSPTWDSKSWPWDWKLSWDQESDWATQAPQLRLF